MIIQIMICILADKPADEQFRHRSQVEVIREIRQRLLEVEANREENHTQGNPVQKELVSYVKQM
ncbi:MAG: hypothetical protein IT233_01825 [Bacteroidia bacterium]|nr:hypothetical protein [Bacteroidia bacterium]